MAKAKRRARSPHPGVKLKKRTLPSGAEAWRAHWRDPATGKEIAKTLDPSALPSKAARVAWAKALSADLAVQRVDLGRGGTIAAPSSIPDAIDSYMRSGPGSRLAPKSRANYAGSFEALATWAAAAGIKTTAELSRVHLPALRDAIAAQPKRRTTLGAPSGSRRATSEPRHPRTINCALVAIKALLGDWRKRGLAPRLTRDDIRDGLRLLPLPRPAAEWLSSSELRRLLGAALRHDAAVPDVERAPWRWRAVDATYRPIAVFVATLLLTGMRRGEALTLEWRDVDLDARDHEGRVVGEIRLRAENVKTRTARVIGLEVSPMLRRILAAWRRRSGADGYVFGGAERYGDGMIQAAARRLRATYGAPAGFTWHALRRSCATYLTCSGSIYGSATVYLSARQLGHSVAIAQRHYLGQHRGVPRDARTLEAAMQIEGELSEVLGAITASAERAARRGAK